MSEKNIEATIERPLDEVAAVENAADTAPTGPKDPEPSICGLSLRQILGCARGEQEGDAALYTQLNRGRFCYDTTNAVYFVYRGPYWVQDLMDESLTNGIALVIKAYQEAQDHLQEKMVALSKEDAKTIGAQIELLGRKIKKLQTLNYRRTVREMASLGKHGIGISADQWDEKPSLFCAKNCVIDLRTGKPRPGMPKDYLCRHSDIVYDPTAAPPKAFQDFLQSVFQFVETIPVAHPEDGEQERAQLKTKVAKWKVRKKNYTPELIDYIQRLFGYALSAEVTEHIFPVFWGVGRNGKGVLLSVIKMVMGSYAGPVQPEILLSNNRPGSSSAASPDITDLKGKRLIWGSETNEGRPLDTAAVKRYSGGDPLVGRNLYARHQIRFDPTHLLVLVTNNKPLVPPDDFAIWERIQLIPFLVSFVEDPDPVNPAQGKINRHLKDQLLDEAPAILRWLVEGHLKYRQSGLKLPEAIQDAIRAYQGEVDVLGVFIAEACNVGEKHSIPAKRFFHAYDDWCFDNGHKRLSSTKFGVKMALRFHRRDSRSGRVYYGVTSDYISLRKLY